MKKTIYTEYTRVLTHTGFRSQSACTLHLRSRLRVINFVISHDSRLQCNCRRPLLLIESLSNEYESSGAGEGSFNRPRAIGRRECRVASRRRFWLNRIAFLRCVCLVFNLDRVLNSARPRRLSGAPRAGGAG